MNPDIYWEVLQFVAFLIIVGSCIFGFYLFRVTNQKFDLPVASLETSDKTLSRARVNKALEYFAEKENKTREILSAPLFIVDPSR